MFGSMMSATDPVAVVALLKELGASPRLGTLIEGESLVNDGTSILIFLVFKNSVDGVAKITAGGIFVDFLRLAGGGVLLGLGGGLLTSFLLSWVFNDTVAEVMLVFAGAYSIFIIAEADGIHVSGVLALVTYGLYMSYKGKMKISASSEHAMHSFWTLLGWMANTVIFLTTGCIMASKVMATTVHITWAEIGLLALLYVVLHIIRGFNVLIQYPFLKRMGYWQLEEDSVSKREALVLVYGGLRGAVGLALALIVEDDALLDNNRTRQLVMLYMAGIAMLTLLINGTTSGAPVAHLLHTCCTPVARPVHAWRVAGMLVRKLGLLKRSKEQDQQFEEACVKMYHDTSASFDKLTKNAHMQMVDWSVVWSYVPVPVAKVYELRTKNHHVPGEHTPWPPRRKFSMPLVALSGGGAGMPGALTSGSGQRASVMQRDYSSLLIETRHRFVPFIGYRSYDSTYFTDYCYFNPAVLFTCNTGL